MRRKCTGAKHNTEAVDSSDTVVGERSNREEAISKEVSGLIRRENAGVSSE